MGVYLSNVSWHERYSVAFKGPQTALKFVVSSGIPVLSLSIHLYSKKLFFFVIHLIHNRFVCSGAAAQYDINSDSLSISHDSFIFIDKQETGVEKKIQQ